MKGVFARGADADARRPVGRPRARSPQHCRRLLDAGCHGLGDLRHDRRGELALGRRARSTPGKALVADGIPADDAAPRHRRVRAARRGARSRSEALALGAPGVLALPPFYYKGVSDDGLFRFFAELIERVGDDRLRLFLYHIPPHGARSASRPS